MALCIRHYFVKLAKNRNKPKWKWSGMLGTIGFPVQPRDKIIFRHLEQLNQLESAQYSLPEFCSKPLCKLLHSFLLLQTRYLCSPIHMIKRMLITSKFLFYSLFLSSKCSGLVWARLPIPWPKWVGPKTFSLAFAWYFQSEGEMHFLFEGEFWVNKDNTFIP